jgi:excisionase family DNA binding protein
LGPKRNTACGELKPLLNTKQVAELLGLSETKVRMMSAAGQIPRVKIGGSVRYDPERLEAWMAKFKEEVKQPPGEGRPSKGRLGRRDPNRPVKFTLD